MLNSFIYSALLSVTHHSDGHMVISPGPVATKGHSNDEHSVISPRAVATKATTVAGIGTIATKAHNSDLLISPTSLAESGTSLH
jgi:hypothetical protein